MLCRKNRARNTVVGIAATQRPATEVIVLADIVCVAPGAVSSEFHHEQRLRASDLDHDTVTVVEAFPLDAAAIQGFAA